MINKFDEFDEDGRTKVDVFTREFNEEELADWLVINSIPPLVKFDRRYLHHVIGVSSPSIALFAS